ncbi:MAG: hypothetical protein V3U37_00165, partial [Nitrospinaceae bacterium]
MKKLFSPLILTVLVFLAYSNTWTHSFHFDDVPSILEKPWIRGLDKIPQFIFSWGQRPLVILSFNLNYAISEFEVWSYHLFNIIFHTLAVLLVYLGAKLAHETVSRDRLEVRTQTAKLPFLAALIFALHPLQTQSVTYISSRSSIMAAIFFLAALILFFKAPLFRKSPADLDRPPTQVAGAVCVGGAAVFFLLGLLTKLIIVTLPAILFLFHYYFVSSENTGRWFVEQRKWILLMIGCLLAGVSYQYFLGGGLLKAQADAPAAADYFLTQTLAVPLEYFRKMLFPFNLSIDSDFPSFQRWGFLTAWSGVFLLFAFIFFWVRISFRKTIDTSKDDFHFRRWFGFGMGWILITLLP